jgi:hypothetical protein
MPVALSDGIGPAALFPHRLPEQVGVKARGQMWKRFCLPFGKETLNTFDEVLILSPWRRQFCFWSMSYG